MTIQGLAFLCNARRVQLTEDGEIYIGENAKKLVTVCDGDGLCVKLNISKTPDELEPLLNYLAANGLVEIAGPCYFCLTYDGYHYIQTIISSVLKFLLASIAVPIGVSVVTTLLTIWLTGGI